MRIDMDIHPAAELFPEMDTESFKALVEDIRENGLMMPIIVHKGEILDGRHRFKACRELGLEPRFTEWQNGNEPEVYVISKNLHRRHLTDGQRAMIAGKIATMKAGDAKTQRGVGSYEPTRSLQEASDLLNVSKISTKRARIVLKHGTPEEIEEVESGKTSVSTAARKVHKKGKATNKSGRLKIPEDFISFIQDARPLESSLNTREIATKIGIGEDAYRKLRDIIGLIDKELPSSERERVTAALEQIKTAHVIAAPYESVRDIVERIFGTGYRHGDFENKTEKKRLEQFHKAFGVIVHCCTNSDLIEIPELSGDLLVKCLKEIKEAKTHLRNLEKRLEELAQ